MEMFSGSFEDGHSFSANTLENFIGKKYLPDRNDVDHLFTQSWVKISYNKHVHDCL